MEGKPEEGTAAFRAGLQPGKERQWRMRQLSVAVQQTNAMALDVYCEWTDICDQCKCKKKLDS
jgi:hypothetical protein